MAGNEFNRLLRECVNSMYQNGHVSPALFVSGYGLNDGAQSVLMKLVELVMHTEYFKEDTKKYLSGKYLSFRSTVKDGYIEVNKSTRQSRIRYDLSKLKAALGEDALKIIVAQRSADLSLYEHKIDGLLKKYREKGLLEGFALRLPKSEKLVTEITQEQQKQLLTLAQHHSKKATVAAEKAFTPEIVGYVQYLEQNRNTLDEGEWRVYLELCQWLR